jgi:hypothetical protein
MAEGNIGSSVVSEVTFTPPEDDKVNLHSWLRTFIPRLNSAMQATARKFSDQSMFSVRRLLTHKGRPVTTSNVAITSGFDAILAVSGNDMCGETEAEITTGNKVDPTLTLTFIDGAWPVAPRAVLGQNFTSGGAIFRAAWSTTTTTLVMTAKGTLPNGKYNFAWILYG